MSDPQISLLAHTVALLQARPRNVPLRKIAEELDLGLPWLQLLARGRFDGKDPGVVKIQKLYEYLAQKPLLNSDSK